MSSERSNKFIKDMRDALIRMLGSKCVRCGKTDKLVLHHKDKNELNNGLANFEVLCGSCHSKEHHVKHFESLRRMNELKREGLKHSRL